jgi:hypothetical protein
MTTLPTPAYAGFARIFWMFVGPVLLVMIAFSIARSGELSVADLVYFGVLGGIILARWAEFRGGSPQTAEGEPATPAHLRRYAVTALSVGLAVWVVARLVAAVSSAT